MALVGNRSVLQKSPARFLNGGAAILRGNFNQHGQMRSAYQAYSPLAATPYGHLSPSAWVLPKTPGGMSSVGFAELTLGASGAGAMGLPAQGSASITIDIAPAEGQLISSGAGEATMTFTADGNVIAALFGAAEATITIATNTPIITALAWGVGGSTMSFTADLVRYGVGNMSGSTIDGGVITNDSITASVWNAVATSYNVAGTMGAKLNSAASGGVDYNALSDAVWDQIIEHGLDAREFLRILIAPIAGDMVVASTTEREFKSLDGTKTRVTATVTGGARDVTLLDGT
jgi:hypothetical protein